uniref:Ig-like domain-containing protein n=1 Tax=Acanthochromis polyacanthus TaxID=80966 RepID=A0A3Q1GJT2_9TELE
MLSAGTSVTLFRVCTHVDAVIVLTQTPAVHTVSTGQEVVLNCNIERNDGYYVSWYKQKPSGAPQYILYFYHSYSSPTFGTGFSSDRFNAKASSSVDYQLIIKQTEEGDSAVYYCRVWDSSASVGLFGQGTKLMVTSSSLRPPVLTVFPPSSVELQSNKATLVCLSSQSGPVSSGISTSTAVQKPDQTFQISSSLDIQTSDWNMDKVYTCKVSMESQTAEKKIQISIKFMDVSL